MPPLVGALGLAAVFSAEVSAADAVLFMLTTSLSQDLYKRFVNRGATDAQVLRVARLTAVVAGALGVAGRDRWPSDVVDALTHLLHAAGVSLFVPILAGLFTRGTSRPRRARRDRRRRDRRRRRAVWRRGAGIKGFTPAMLGLIGAFGAYVVVRR